MRHFDHHHHRRRPEYLKINNTVRSTFFTTSTAVSCSGVFGPWPTAYCRVRSRPTKNGVATPATSRANTNSSRSGGRQARNYRPVPHNGTVGILRNPAPACALLLRRSCTRAVSPALARDGSPRQPPRPTAPGTSASTPSPPSATPPPSTTPTRRTFHGGRPAVSYRCGCGRRGTLPVWASSSSSSSSSLLVVLLLLPLPRALPAQALRRGGCRDYSRRGGG